MSILQKWEYWRMFEENLVIGVDERLSQAGEDGWELVTIYPQPTGGAYYVFKRPSINH